MLFSRFSLEENDGDEGVEVADLGHVLRVEAVPLPPLGEGPHVDGLEATHAQHLHDPGQEGRAVKAFQCNKKNNYALRHYTDF